MRKFEAEKHDYLQGQIGNPGAASLPCAPGVLCRVAALRVRGVARGKCQGRASRTRGAWRGRARGSGATTSRQTPRTRMGASTRLEPDAQTCAEGADKPNKKFYDPRVWIRKSEEAAVERLGEAFADLNSVGVLA